MPADDGELTLTVVIPALNEEDNIALAIQNALDAIDEIKIAAEVIVVNDGPVHGSGSWSLATTRYARLNASTSRPTEFATSRPRRRFASFRRSSPEFEG